ncbi:MAG: sugar phosphate isomerase/epimerase, partial [Endomicrobia bacterium]|nr:sugar phosphate isomerase/epimerase [Endomicrobiia bacterium]
MQGLTPSGSNYDGYRDILNNDFWLVGIFSKNSQFDLDTTLKDLKHDFEIRAEEVKKAAEAKGIKLIAHLQGQPPDSGAWWPNYDNDGKEALNGLTKILDAQLEIAGLLGITSLVLHLNGDKNNEEAMKGYVAFIEKAASMGITINLENEIIYEKNDYNHNTTLGERGFADYRTFIDALEEINKGLSENGRKHMGALIDTGKALQSFTDNSKTDAAGNISDEEFNLQTAKINLEHLKEYYEAVRKAGFNINEIHLAQSSVLPSDVKDEKGKDGKGRKVFYKKTRIEENKNPNLYISDFLTFLNEKTENNETRFKGVVIQETDGFTVPAGKSATQEAPAEQKDKVFEPIKNRFDEAVSVYRKEKTDDNARELIKAAYSYVLASDRNVTQALETQKAVDAALKEFGFKDSSIYERFWPDNKAPKYSLNNEKYRWVDTIIRFVEKPIFASDWDKFYEAKSIKERIERVIKDAGVEFGYERKENGAHFNFYKNSMSIELTGKDFSDFGERQVEILKKIIDNGGYTGVKFVKNDSDARSCTITFELGKVEEVADAEQSLIKLAAAEQNLIKIFDEFKKQSESGNASATAEKVTSAVSTQQPAAKPASSFTARVTAFIALLLFPLSLFVSESLPVSNISGMGHGFIIVGILAVVAAAAILLQVFGIIKPWYASYGALRTEGRIKQTANDFGKEAEIKSEGNIFTRNYTLSAYADDKNADGKNIDMLLKIFQEYPRFAAERIFTGTEIFFSSDYTSIKIKFKARNEKELLKAEQELKEILIKFKEQTGEAQAETPALTRKEVASNKVSIFDEKAINQLIEDVIAVSGAQWSEGSKAIFRETRKAYFAQLRAKAKGEKTSELRIGENFTPLSQMADADRIYVAFEQLKDVLNDPRGAFSEAARNTFVDICFMNGGMGSSLKRDDLLKAVKVYQEAVAAAMQIKDETLRENTLSNLRASLIDGTFLQKDFKGVKIQYGAKSDDLFFVVRDKNGNPELKNITQIKLEKILAEQTNETYKGVSLAMLVSPDSKPLVENLYDGRMNGLEEGETIRTKLNADMEMQDMYPVLKLESDSEGKPSAVSFVTDYEPEVSPENAKPAPGGHGVWLATIVKRILNKKAAGSAISVIGNSDAVASGPIKELVGHMAKDRVGISIISVDRETVDKKGGVFGLAVKEVRDADGKLIKTIKVPTLMERAQAVAVNQKDLFEDLGFKDETQPFNSNTVFINDDVIRRLHDGLIEIFMAGGMSREQAEAKFDALMLPDLIDNTKDGYTKLEGALCSAVLNMNSALEVMRIQNPAVDALLNNILGKDQPLVRLVNANSELRDLVFTPIKFATDFWIQFVNGELVKGDLKSLSPKNHGAVNVECLKDSKDKDYPNYTDVSYFLKNWTRMNIKNLNNLYIDGDKVKMSGLDLRGDVTIRNESSKDFTVSATKLPSTDSLGNKWLFPIVDGKVVLEDMTIIREKTGATRIIVSATQMLRRVEAAFSRQGGKYEIAYRDTNDEIKSTVIANLEQKYGSRITIQENTSKGKAFTITLSEEKAAIALPEST